ncbi:NAD(P)-dependent oxidoreductase [Streptomyces sp. NPDC101178]|uniref:NAD(P)-dependent oxidoreductase n=1 Tax=Streptomyces sp. NPDC101178 TaxID=3366124 RepID=UPI0038017E49
MTTQPKARKTSVTVLGLGSMGQALAGAFLRAGHPTTVWNRSPEKGEELVSQGATLAATPGDAVRAGELVLICVIDYDSADAVLETVDTADLAGRLLVNVATSTSERSREFGDWAAKHEIDYLDGAIMIGPNFIDTPDSLVFLSGSRTGYDTHHAVFDALGGRVRYVGEDPGFAALYDMSLLDFLWTGMSGMMHAFALAGSDGVKAADFAPYLDVMLDTVRMLAPDTAREIDEGAYPGGGELLTMRCSNVDDIIRAAELRGVDTAVLRAVASVEHRAKALGHRGATSSYTATYEAVRRGRATE